MVGLTLHSSGKQIAVLGSRWNLLQPLRDMFVVRAAQYEKLIQKY
jgi:hypothetical protein